MFLDADAEVLVDNQKRDENSPPGTNVGKPVTAADAPGDILTYTLGGARHDEPFQP